MRRAHLPWALAASLGCSDPTAHAKGPALDVAPALPSKNVSSAQADPSGPAAERASTDASEARSGAAPANVTGALDPAPVGHLERPDSLVRFFRALASLEDRRATEDVRVVQFGDSHTASDLGTSVLRRILQGRFGDGGRGLVSLGRPWKTYAQDGIRGGMTDGFEPVRAVVRAAAGPDTGDGSFGLVGVGIAAAKPGERAWTEVAAPASRLEIDYWKQAAGGTFEVAVDGAAVGRVQTRGSPPSSGFFEVDVPEAPHQVEVRTLGDGDVRLLGLALDRAGAGAVVDALGVNGAEMSTPLRSSEAHFAEQLRHRAPALVVLAYGTNESLQPKLTDSDYERSIVELLGRVSRAVPAAACLLLGPTDRAERTGPQGRYASAPRVAEIVQVQRRAAHAAGCAFYDQLAAMGGPGSIDAWASEAEPRAGHDRVHLTRSGYALLATWLAGDLLRAYDAWRSAASPRRPEEHRAGVSDPRKPE